MSTPAIIILISAVIVAAVALYLVRRRAVLRSRFGPEYERTVQTAGNTFKAEADLAARAKRVSRYELKPLPPEEGDRFTRAWRLLQARFVDDPAGAVNEADRLVTDLMARRGYPMADFDRRVEDLSVEHGEVVNHYREAHQIAVRQSDGREPTTTEDLRRAVTHYRALFEDLLDIATAPGRRQTA